MRTALILTTLLCLFSAPSALAEGIDLRSVGLSPNPAAGRANGEQMNVIVLTDSSLDELKGKAKAKYPVDEISEDGQRTVLIVDVTAGPKRVVEASYIFSELRLPNGGNLVFGTPLGPLARGLRNTSPKYHGSALGRLPAGSTLVLETGFTFGQAKVDTSTINVRAAPSMARTLFVEALVKAGYVADSAPSESASASAPLGFRKGQSVVHIIVNAGASGSEAKVILHEVSVP